ncbi:Developmentally-regulated GTP-binding protein [Carpediemonas membranifera]|uniref:Developmentally-regulated GTP-binding protein n=1 Tax=Carpediemonas membranifera TaxID=201153 RepID=A0A8J6E3V4_9EUKA|nr:Developmentally-regulated GTP-binding protein [Carpediemonas membranifera]|eukprot:KAG9396056.1 Developmentally-regulated GTP-binding protein [Carpediemonas membranifera]
MGVAEKIKDIEAEIARTQYNKATEYHIGLLKGKLARLRTQLLDESSQKTKGYGLSFDVMKSGSARVALVGFPSVGKSSLLNTLTETESEAAAYEFTTLTAVPGNLYINGAKIQLLDLPGIIEGAAVGKGRGRQVISTARTADLVLMVMDAAKGDTQRRLLTHELETMGIRLNTRPPDITIDIKKTGGIKFTSTVPLTHVTEHMVKNILSHEHKCHHAHVLFREDATVDQLIDVLEGNRVYMPCVYVYNKIDNVSIDAVDYFSRQPFSICTSVTNKMNLQYLLALIWRNLGLVRVYTKPRGQQPDLDEPVILRSGATTTNICQGIHKDMMDVFNYAYVWGCSVKHQPQKVGRDHLLADEDVVQVMTRS